jgi:FlaA1/EpsC-like NDP-sugar epimerase
MQQFYSDKHILLTGATGFLGKVIIEKKSWEHFLS